LLESKALTKEQNELLQQFKNEHGK